MGWTAHVAGIGTAALLAGAAGAQDACPTAADMPTGVGVAYATGIEVVYRTTDRPGLLAVETRSPDGVTVQGETMHGMFQLWTAAVVTVGEATTQLRTDYLRDLPPDALPAPEPGTRYQGTATVRRSSGDQPVAEARAYGEPTTATVAGCRYEAYEVLLVEEDGGIFSSGGWYIPELGFGVSQWFETSGEPRQPNEVTRIWVSD